MRFVFSFMRRRAMALFVAGICVGFAAPDLARACAPALYGAALLSMFLAAVRLDWPAVGRQLRRPWLAMAVILAAMGALPLVASAVCRLVLPADSALAAALTVAASGPPLSSATAYAVFLGLDSALCLIATVSAMALAPLLMPPLVLGLIGIQSDLSILDFAVRLAVMVGVSLAGGLLIRGLFGPAWVEREADWLDGTLVLSILVVEIGVMDGVQAVVVDDPAKALVYLLAAFALNLAMSLSALLAAPWLDRRRLLSVALLLGNRNGMLLLATFGVGAEADVRLFLVLIQVPLAVMPSVFALICRRVLGPAE